MAQLSPWKQLAQVPEQTPTLLQGPECGGGDGRELAGYCSPGVHAWPGIIIHHVVRDANTQLEHPEDVCFHVQDGE